MLVEHRVFGALQLILAAFALIGGLHHHGADASLQRTPLRAELDQIRRQGWATAPNQSIIGLNALAAPIMDALGSFVGAIAIVDSVQFIPEDPSAKQIKQIIDAGKRISANIGYREK